MGTMCSTEGTPRVSLSVVFIIEQLIQQLKICAHIVTAGHTSALRQYIKSKFSIKSR